MNRFFFCLLLLLSISGIFAVQTPKYLIRIDLEASYRYYGVRNISQLEDLLPSEINIFHISKNYLLTDADDKFLREVPRFLYSLLDRFPLTENWYLFTPLPGRQNVILSDWGTEVSRFDESILVSSILNELQLRQYTDMPYVRMDFLPLKLRSELVQNISQPSRINFGNMLNHVNQDSIMWFIQQLQNFQTRNAIAPNRLQVANWIRDQFIRFGITNAHVEQFFVQGYDQYNVVATIPGTIAPNKYIIVGGHHDSIVSNGNPDSFAPGADDNASGTAAALEMARVMQANNYQPETSIRFVTFACEEYGLFGSKYHSQQAYNQGQNVKLMINHDMIGYSTQTSDDWLIRLMPYTGFEGYTYYAMNVVETQTTLNPYPGGINSPSSDSHPFWQKGYPVIYFFEHEFNPYYHSVNDLVVNINPQYVKEAIKASTAVCLTYDQIPSPVDYVSIQDAGTGTSLVVNWSMFAPESDITGYKVYVTDDPQVTPIAYNTTGSSYILNNLVNGTMYYIGVAAVDGDNNAGLARFVTGIPYLHPQTPVGFHDLPVLNAVNLQWLDNNELDLAGYRIYRSTAPEGPFTMLAQTNPGITYYYDESVASLIYYYYKLTAVDTDYNESAPTAVLRTRAITLNQGILIVDETSNNSSNTVFSPNDEVSDLFYDTVLHNFPRTQFDTETDGVLRLADMGVYSAILWHGNDTGNQQYPYLVRDELRNYIIAGGKVLITSYFPSKAFDNNTGYPNLYETGNYMFDTFGIEEVHYHNSARFRYAVPESSGFPPLTVDSLKTVGPLAGHIYNIESISANYLASNVYYYGSDYANTASQGVMNGMAVGVYHILGCGRSVVLSFPLFNMKQDEVTNLMHHVFYDLFGINVSVDDNTLPPMAEIAFSRAYPNPFSNYISLDIKGTKAGQNLKAGVYNAKGQKVKTLYNDTAKSANQTLSWDGRDDKGYKVSNSIYYIRAEQDGKAAVKKVLKLN